MKPEGPSPTVCLEWWRGTAERGDLARRWWGDALRCGVDDMQWNDLPIEVAEQRMNYHQCAALLPQ